MLSTSQKTRKTNCFRPQSSYAKKILVALSFFCSLGVSAALLSFILELIIFYHKKNQGQKKQEMAKMKEIIKYFW